jgi:hypothetical protein
MNYGYLFSGTEAIIKNLDTLGLDNGALSVRTYTDTFMYPSACGSGVHSASALTSGFHLTPTL